MKIIRHVRKEIEVKYLKASVHVRYWEDSTLDDMQDADGQMPGRKGEMWEPIISLEDGVIANWKIGHKASIHYKVCDEGEYYLLDENHKAVAKMPSGSYVPDIMCPKGDGYGDYVIMDVNSDGMIDKWKIDLTPFNSIEDENNEI